MVIERLNYANYGLCCVQICFFILLHDVYSDKPTSLVNLELKDCLYEVLKNKQIKPTLFHKNIFS